MEVLNEALLSIGEIIKAIAIVGVVLFIVFCPVLSEIFVPFFLGLTASVLVGVIEYEGITGSIILFGYGVWIFLRIRYFYPWLEKERQDVNISEQSINNNMEQVK